MFVANYLNFDYYGLIFFLFHIACITKVLEDYFLPGFSWVSLSMQSGTLMYLAADKYNRHYCYKYILIYAILVEEEKEGDRCRYFKKTVDYRILGSRKVTVKCHIPFQTMCCWN
jgi:hypothetical protein